MKKLSRILSMVLAIAMLLSLAACAPGPGNDTTGGTAGSTGDKDPTGTTGTTPPTDPSMPEGDFPEIPDGHNQIVIYWDYSGDLSTAAFWIWPEGGNGAGYPVEADAYGCRTVVNIPSDVTKVGFIACYGCSSTSGSTWIGGTKDVDQDRFIEVTGERTIAYLKSGDPNIYYSNGGGSLEVTKEIKMAGIASLTTVKYTVNPRVRITSLDQIKIMDGDRQLGIKELSSLNNEVVSGTITLAEELDLTKIYTIEIEGYGTANLVPNEVFDSPDFIDSYTYDGDDLGPVIHGNTTTFKVWAPTASKVVLNLFEKGDGVAAYANVEMTKADRGVWEYTAECGHGTYYTYTVTTAVGTQEATDPYAKAAGLNGNRSMVVDLDTTDPEKWGSDKVVTLDKYTDATIWEVHVRDFSNKIASSKYPGKYLAFTERGLTNSSGVPVGVDYLLNLGVSHIHLLPVYDFATVDESGNGDQFNWGYDPKNYNVPEGSYSTDPYNGEVRINEYKQMVQSLHNVGLGVIMDVVYNHTYDGNSSFNKIVPYYYYRYDEKGGNTSASGCGNDTASERYMFRKFMVDSVSYWAEEYHLDGFRFDLMGLHDVQTMQEIEKAVHAINPDAIIYGEAWNMAGSTTDAEMATQPNIGKIETTDGAAGAVAVFNDAIRDGLKGSVFEAKGQGYINGAFAANLKKVQFGIAGGSLSGIGWTVPNAAVINYMSAHDNNTLWDKLLLSNPDNSVEERLAMNRLGAAILMISKGTPFWQAGEEMLRTKDGNENSYNSGDAINNIDWDALVPGSDAYAMMEYYQGLLKIREEYDIFRSNGEDVTITFDKLGGDGMTVHFVAADGDEALVLINPVPADMDYTLNGTWEMVSDGLTADDEEVPTSGTVKVTGRSVMIFVK